MRKVILEDGSIRFEVMEQLLTEEEFDRMFPPSDAEAGASLQGYKRPVPSEALAVHPRQRKEAIEDAIKKGVPTDFDKKGRPLFTSTRHKAAYCRQYGFYNRDAGYSDAQRGSCKRDVPPPPDPRTLY